MPVDNGFQLFEIVGSETVAARGDGLMSLYPKVTPAGKVERQETETTIRSLVAKDMTLGTAAGHEVFNMGKSGVELDITSHRLIFNLPNWRRGMTIGERMAMWAMDRESNSNEATAFVGHLPLEALTSFGYLKSRATVFQFQFMHQARSAQVMHITWPIPSSLVEGLLDTVVKANKRRWARYELPDGLPKAIAQAKPTTEMGEGGPTPRPN